MMENKLKLKKCLICILLISICLLSLFLIINIYEYKVYTKNFNSKIELIVAKIAEKYPAISENEIMEILNSKDVSVSFFEKYGIDTSEDSIILENYDSHYKFLLLNIIFLFLSIVLVVLIFLRYNKVKDKEISDITKYIEEINKKNYALHIDEISEDELSILKNEIYKTTVMLKENADNSLNDKKQLKRSLEDISHQLKTPLTSILVMLDDLIDDENMDSYTREEFIRAIRREVVNINFLIQAILKLSKFDSNTVIFTKNKIFLKDIIEKSIKNVSTLCDLKNIEIEVKGHEKAELDCDYRWQVEALTNIIKNCVDYSKQNGKIIISYEQNNVYSSVMVRDFGDGISEEDLPHIFERFYKGKNATPDSIGIGLALSKSIVEEDNGSISVDSDRNGTSFVIKYFSV